MLIKELRGGTSMNLDQFTYDGSRKIDLFHAETGASKDEKKKKDSCVH